MTRRGLLAGLFVALLCAPLLLLGDEDPNRDPKPTPPKPKPMPPESKPRPDQKATLAGQPGFERAKGTARYRDRPDERELDVIVEKTALPYGTKLSVLINGTMVGEIETGLLHGGKLKLRSKDKDVIPFITIGSNVTVRTKEKAVVSGRF